MGTVCRVILSTEDYTMAVRAISLLLALASVTSAQVDLQALCPAYPICDNALIAAYTAAAAQPAPAGAPQPRVAASPELPCPNYPFCDVNHAALAQGVPCANFPNCDVNHVALAQRAGRRRRDLWYP